MDGIRPAVTDHTCCILAGDETVPIWYTGNEGCDYDCSGMSGWIKCIHFCPAGGCFLQGCHKSGMSFYNSVSCDNTTDDTCDNNDSVMKTCR